MFLLQQRVERAEHAGIVAECGKGEVRLRAHGRHDELLEAPLEQRPENLALRHDTAAEHDDLWIEQAADGR